MTQVKHYGVHWEGATGWLQQGRGGTNAVGLAKRTPFQNPRSECNHLVPMTAPIPDKNHWRRFMAIYQDPLVRAMIPIPRAPEDRAFFVEDPYDDLNLYLSCLSRMSSPIHSITRPAWMIKGAELEREMNSTNIQTWVITQVSKKQIDILNAINKSTQYLPRTVILTGDGDIPIPPNIKKIKTNIRETEINDLMTLPLENIGALLLRRHLRKEGLFDPLETRNERRERLLRERK